MSIVTRQEAIERGAKRFYVGDRCRKGHLSERYAVDGQCCECCKSNRRARAWKLRMARRAETHEMAMRYIRKPISIVVISIKDEWEPIKQPTLAQLMAGK